MTSGALCQKQGKQRGKMTEETPELRSDKRRRKRRKRTATATVLDRRKKSLTGNGHTEGQKKGSRIFCFCFGPHSSYI